MSVNEFLYCFYVPFLLGINLFFLFQAEKVKNMLKKLKVCLKKFIIC